MTDETTLRRARQAESELRETASAFEQVRAEIVKQWAATSLGDVEYREKLFMAYRTTDLVRAALTSTVNNGQLLRHEAEVAQLFAPRG